MSQNGQIIYYVTLKKPENKKKFVFISVSMTCWIFWGFEHLSSAIGQKSYVVGKATENCWFLADYEVQIYSTPAANMWT